jgi:hypothetical protein
VSTLTSIYSDYRKTEQSETQKNLLQQGETDYKRRLYASGTNVLMDDDDIKLGPFTTYRGLN